MPVPLLFFVVIPEANLLFALLFDLPNQRNDVILSAAIGVPSDRSSSLG